MNYYNEFDSFAAAWLRELIKEGLIPDGEVDERSIIDVDGKDLKGFTQCHFFTGIGGWSYALELAGWEPTRPVWTGSPPCQPFSVAGNKKGQDDERHLWWAFFKLIRQCKPATVFGEQVAAAIRTEWFDDLQADMENEGYATAMAVLPACSVGAPHKRERLFFVSDSIDSRQSTGSRRWSSSEPPKQGDDIGWNGEISTISNTGSSGLERRSQIEREGSEYKSRERDSIWSDVRSDAPPFADGKRRAIPSEPALFPLANGVPNRMGLLRGAGNAIVPQVAAEVIKAYMDYASQESQM